jgi:hypothetical protein
MKATQVLKKIGTALGLTVELEQIKLVDGVTILEADAFEPGAEVFIVMEEELVPLAVGEYELEDGRMLLIEQEGVIANVSEGGAEEEAPAPAQEEAPVQQGADRLPKKVIESIVHEQHFGKQPKGKMEEESEGAVAPEDVVSTVEEAEAVVTEEIVAIISELTPDTVAEGDAAEIANDVLVAITDTIASMPEDVAASSLSKVKKYGRTKMSEEEAAVIEGAQAEVVSAITEAVNAGTPEEVTPEISQEIAATIVEAVVEIVAEQPAEMSKQIFRRSKPVTSKVKNSAVKKRVDMAKAKIEKLQEKRVQASAKPIKHNPENKKKVTDTYRISPNKQVGYVDRIFSKLFNKIKRNANNINNQHHVCR